MKTETPVEALAKAIAQVGSQASFAAALAQRMREPVSQARVWNWLNRDGGAPSDVCPDIEEMTGVRCERLCPAVNWAVLRATSQSVSTAAASPADSIEAKEA